MGEIGIGSIVRLKSGGPSMIVERTDFDPAGGTGRVAHFVMMAPTGLIRGYLPMALLEVVEQDVMRADPVGAEFARSVAAVREVVDSDDHGALSDRQCAKIVHAVASALGVPFGRAPESIADPDPAWAPNAQVESPRLTAARQSVCPRCQNTGIEIAGRRRCGCGAPRP